MLSFEPPQLRAIALAYIKGGWCPIELPEGAKAPPPDGRTGYGGSDYTLAEVEDAGWLGNIGLRMPADVLGIDCDCYHGGGRTILDLAARLGPVPNSWVSHNGRGDGSGIGFYRVPPGFAWVTGLAGVEVIQRVHRYAVVWPSVHPSGRSYRWTDPAGEATTQVPLVEDLPELPWAWIGELSRAQTTDLVTPSRAVDLDGLSEFLDVHVTAEAPGYISTIVEHFNERRAQGFSRHDSMQHCLTWSMECVRAGIAAGRPTVATLAEAWVEAMGPDRRRAELWSERRTTELEAMLRHAIGKVEAKPQAEIDRLHDEIAGIPMRPAPAPVVVEPVETPAATADDGLPRPIDWSAFATRDDTERKWLVEGFWPWGRSMALWAAAKMGKSELALWCAAKLALGEHPWTGEKIEPVDVAYFDFEMTEDDLEDRLAAFDIRPRRLARLHYFLLPALHALDVEQGGIEVERLAAKHGVQAAVFDTFGRAVGGDENEADTVRAFYRHTGSRLKRMGVGYLRTDHAGKDMAKGQRGSSAKRDDVDVIWSMRRGEHGVVYLNCAGSSRLGWVEPELKLERAELNGALAYTTEIRIGWPAGTAQKVAELDEIGYPIKGNKNEARAALSAAGKVGGTNELLGAALRYRLERAADPTFPQVRDQ